MGNLKDDSEIFAPRFHSIARILRPTIKSFADRERKSLREAIQSLADKIDSSFDAVDSWRRGVRNIPPGKIELLVKQLGYGTQREINELVKRLNKARSVQAQPSGSWKEHVDKDKGYKLKVEEALYKGDGRLWQKIFFPFLNAASIRYTPKKPSSSFFQLQDAVWSGKLDVAMGILATPRMSLKLWFFSGPPEYRINCLVPSDFVGKQNLTAQEMLLARDDDISKAFMPIIMRGEVGELYALNDLKLGQPVEVESFDIKLFARKFREAKASSRERTPLIVVDEITSLEIKCELGDEAKLVFPLVPDLKHETPPAFPLGLCVSRNERLGHAKKSELMGFIRDALTAYIIGNAHNIALAYVDLCAEIKKLVERSLPEYPAEDKEEWIKRTFSLEQRLINLQPAHWRAVLQRAVQIMTHRDEFLGHSKS